MLTTEVSVDSLQALQDLTGKTVQWRTRPTHSCKAQTRTRKHTPTPTNIVNSTIKDLCAVLKTWSKYLGDLVSNGGCKEKSCYYSRIYYTLLRAVPWEEKGEETYYFLLLEGIIELGCLTDVYVHTCWSMCVYEHMCDTVLSHLSVLIL